MSQPASAPRPIAVDAMGGDHAPAELVAGAVRAVRKHQVSIILVGQPARLRPLLAEHGAAGQIAIAAAEDTLAMDAGALASWRRPRSSIAVACHLARTGEAAAVVSAGSTAAVVATARLRLRGQHGVLRPAIAVVLPTQPRPVVLIDAGGNADAKPEMLVQFAQLGSAYAEVALGVRRPRVGLLSIGSEPAKGSKLSRRAHELLTAAPVHFTGNIEGTDVLRGGVDVVVTDGFTGNVVLKTVEGSVRYAFDEVREALTGNWLARLSGSVHRRRLTALAGRMNPESQGGAVLLGLNGTVVIAHGRSRAPAITAACRLAQDLGTGGIIDRIGEQMAAASRAHRRGRH